MEKTATVARVLYAFLLQLHVSSHEMRCGAMYRLSEFACLVSTLDRTRSSITQTHTITTHARACVLFAHPLVRCGLIVIANAVWVFVRFGSGGIVLAVSERNICAVYKFDISSLELPHRFIIFIQVIKVDECCVRGYALWRWRGTKAYDPADARESVRPKQRPASDAQAHSTTHCRTSRSDCRRNHERKNKEEEKNTHTWACCWCMRSALTRRALWNRWLFFGW